MSWLDFEWTVIKHWVVFVWSGGMNGLGKRICCVGNRRSQWTSSSAENGCFSPVMGTFFHVKSALFAQQKIQNQFKKTVDQSFIKQTFYLVQFHLEKLIWGMRMTIIYIAITRYIILFFTPIIMMLVTLGRNSSLFVRRALETSNFEYLYHSNYGFESRLETVHMQRLVCTGTSLFGRCSYIYTSIKYI